MDITAQRTRRTHRQFPVLLGLLLLIALATGACTFEVQPIEEYASRDGYLSLTYPAAWDLLDEDASDGTTTVFLGTGANLIDMDVIPPGEAGVGIMLMPNFIPEPGLDVLTLEPEELAGLIRGAALEEQGSEVSELEPALLANGVDAYTFSAYSPEGDITVYSFAPAEEMLAVAFVMTAPGEEDAVLMAEAEKILGSVQFHGDPAEFADRAREILGGGN